MTAVEGSRSHAAKALIGQMINDLTSCHDVLAAAHRCDFNVLPLKVERYGVQREEECTHGKNPPAIATYRY